MEATMTDLAGTRVVVTGGTSGLGRAMAVALAATGARVAITSRQRARAAVAADELGAGTCGVELDVRDEASVDAFVEEVYGRFGEIDMLGQQRRDRDDHRQPPIHDRPPALLGAVPERISRTSSKRSSSGRSWSRER
jgi:nucleoside-diphosphate-sugar epimerase